MLGGPRLAGLIVMLRLRYRFSRAKVQGLLWQLLGLQLSAGPIDQTIRLSVGQVAPPACRTWTRYRCGNVACCYGCGCSTP